MNPQNENKQQNPPEPQRWNQNCSQCGQEIPQGSGYAVCADCLQKGKDSGWFDETW